MSETATVPEARKSPIGLIVMLLFMAAVIGGASFWWIEAGKYEETDDAQVSAHMSAVSSRVAGTVTAVYVEEGQFVKTGQLIAELDSRDFENAVEQAKSQEAPVPGAGEGEQSECADYGDFEPGQYFRGGSGTNERAGGGVGGGAGFGSCRS